MNVLVSVLFLLLINFRFEVIHSKCNSINTYKNNLPASIEYLSKNDNMGAVIVFSLRILRSFVSYLPNYNTSENLCNTNLLQLSDHVVIKVGLRPRGCCAYCCLIDKIEDHLSFSFFTKDNGVKVLKLSSIKKPGTLAALGFKNESKTIVWSHGFTEDGLGSSVSVVANAYLKQEEHYNYLALDYSEVATFPWYFEAIDNLKPIAKAVAKFLIFYHKTGELRIDKIHLNGISLGAQMSSHLAKQLSKFRKPARLTGLDPAITIHRDDDFAENFSPDDAEFVDIIHSSSGIIRDIQPSGHADFYVDYPPNTTFRPGCDLLTMADRGELPFYAICDHLRALRIFLHTMRDPYSFPVCKYRQIGSDKTKKICGYVGFAANKSNTFGEYHFSTPPKWNPWNVYDLRDNINKIYHKDP